MKEGEFYTFSDMESFLNDWSNRSKCLLVSNVGQNAIMHVFSGNLCGDWESGDGILFYDDNEQHSSEPDDKFKLLKIIDLLTLEHLI